MSRQDRDAFWVFMEHAFNKGSEEGFAGHQATRDAFDDIDCAIEIVKGLSLEASVTELLSIASRIREDRKNTVAELRAARGVE